MRKIRRQSDGFTLVELLLVVAITALTATVIFANIQQSEKTLAVQHSTQLLVAALREAQNDALGGKGVGNPMASPVGGFGVYIPSLLPLLLSGGNPILFADINNNHIYDSGEEQRAIMLDSSVILSTKLTASASITFIPPHPVVLVYIGAEPQTDGSDFEVTLEDGSAFKTVHVNSVGAIWAQ